MGGVQFPQARLITAPKFETLLWFPTVDRPKPQLLFSIQGLPKESRTFLTLTLLAAPFHTSGNDSQKTRAPPPVHTVPWLGSYSPSLPTPGAFFPWNVLGHKGGALGQASHQIHLQGDMLLPLFYHSEEARTLCSLFPCSVIYFYLNELDM